MIKTPVTYTIHDPNRFGFAVYKDANGTLSPEQIAAALNNTADQSRVIEVLRERLNELPREVPTNWLHPLLSGDKAVVKTSDNREIEALLRGIQDRQCDFVEKALAEAQRIMEGK